MSSRNNRRGANNQNKNKTKNQNVNKNIPRRRNRRSKNSFDMRANLFGVKGSLSFKETSELRRPETTVTGGVAGSKSSICLRAVESIGNVTTEGAPLLAGSHIAKIKLSNLGFPERLYKFADLYEMFNFDEIMITYQSVIAPVNTKAHGSIIIYYLPDPETPEPIEDAQTVQEQAQRVGSVIIPVKSNGIFNVDLKQSIRSGVTQFYIHANSDVEDRFYSQGTVYVTAYTDLDSDVNFGQLFMHYKCCLHSPAISRKAESSTSKFYLTTGTVNWYIGGWQSIVDMPNWVNDRRVDLKSDTDVAIGKGFEFTLPKGHWMIEFQAETISALGKFQAMGNIAMKVLEGDATLVNNNGGTFTFASFCQAPDSEALSFSHSDVIGALGVVCHESTNKVYIYQTASSGTLAFADMFVVVSKVNWATTPSMLSKIPDIEDIGDLHLRKRLKIGTWINNRHVPKVYAGIPKHILDKSRQIVGCTLYEESPKSKEHREKQLKEAKKLKMMELKESFKRLESGLE